MKTIVTIQFGSHLYGTNTPASDRDWKEVFIPPTQDILLQRVENTVSTQRAKARFEKNTTDDVDVEGFSLQRFVGLVLEGQILALDMLFAPAWAIASPPNPVWEELVANRHRLFSKNFHNFVTYALKQSSKYGVKGSRVAAARKALTYLKDAANLHGPMARLSECAPAIKIMVAETEHMELIPITMPSGGIVMHWVVCGRKLPYASSIKNTHDIVQHIVREYGHRALQAEQNKGIDWKALSHAVRAAHQGIEFLRTQHITFPLPNAAHILEIKSGALSYQQVSKEVEDLMEAVVVASGESALPEVADVAWADQFVERVYRQAVVDEAT